MFYLKEHRIRTPTNVSIWRLEIHWQSTNQQTITKTRVLKTTDFQFALWFHPRLYSPYNWPIFLLQLQMMQLTHRTRMKMTIPIPPHVKKTPGRSAPHWQLPLPQKPTRHVAPAVQLVVMSWEKIWAKCWQSMLGMVIIRMCVQCGISSLSHAMASVIPERVLTRVQRVVKCSIWVWKWIS